MNMFEQISGLGQMPLVEQGGARSIFMVPVLGEVQCIYGHIGTRLPKASPSSKFGLYHSRFNGA